MLWWEPHGYSASNECREAAPDCVTSEYSQRRLLQYAQFPKKYTLVHSFLLSIIDNFKHQCRMKDMMTLHSSTKYLLPPIQIIYCTVGLTEITRITWWKLLFISIQKEI